MDLMFRFAVLGGQLEVVRNYLANDLNPSKFGHDRGYSLVEYAVSHGYMDMWWELLETGVVSPAMNESIIESSYLNLQNVIDGSLLLLRAAFYWSLRAKDYQMLKKLISDYGFDFNIGEVNRLPLHLAITTNNYQMVRLCLKVGANPELTNTDNENAFDLAYKNSIENKCSECAQNIYLLLEKYKL